MPSAIWHAVMMKTVKTARTMGPACGAGVIFPILRLARRMARGMGGGVAAGGCDGEAGGGEGTTAAGVLGRGSGRGFEGKGDCFLEAGGGVAGMAQGDFYGNPRRIGLKPPSPVWHWGKVALERYWLWKWY